MLRQKEEFLKVKRTLISNLVQFRFENDFADLTKYFGHRPLSLKVTYVEFSMYQTLKTLRRFFWRLVHRSQKFIKYLTKKMEKLYHSRMTLLLSTQHIKKFNVLNKETFVTWNIVHQIWSNCTPSNFLCHFFDLHIFDELLNILTIHRIPMKT